MIVFIGSDWPDLTAQIRYTGPNQPIVTGATATLTIIREDTGVSVVLDRPLALVVNNNATKRTIDWTAVMQASDYAVAGVFSLVVTVTLAGGRVHITKCAETLRVHSVT
jgi:hypothetical protein